MEEQTRRYRFQPYGPFEMPVDSQHPAVLDKGQLKQFWTAIEALHPGLSEAIGCYIYGIRSKSSELPWYVGKTEKRTFKFEAVQSSKLVYYENALRTQPGTPMLYLLPRLTDAGSFRTAWKSGSSSVDRLEGMLIATALSRNPKLLNRLKMKHLTQTEVPGYINEPPGPRSKEAKKLAALLGTASEKKQA